MAYKVILSNRFSKKLAKLYAYLETNFSPEVTIKLVKKIEKKMLLVEDYPAIGVLSSKMPGIYKISISRYNKLYYLVKGRKIIMLDLFDLSSRSQIPVDLTSA